MLDIRLTVSTTPLLLSLALGAVFSILTFSRRSRGIYSRLPPGPKPLPVLGNRIPEIHPWRHFYDLSKHYGPLLTIWIGSRPTIFISSVKDAEGILNKRAGETAGRPRAIMAGELLSRGQRILLVDHNEQWRRLRKAMHHPLQPDQAKQMRPVQTKNSRVLMLDLLDNPAEFQAHTRTYAASVVLNLAYGRTTQARYTDYDITRIVETLYRLGLCMRNGAFWVEALPFLRYVPGYTNQVKQWSKEELTLFRDQLKDARQRLSAGTADPCFVSWMSQRQAEFELTDDELAAACGSLFGAGSDTTSAALNVCILAALKYPEAQKVVQHEMDRVVGQKRMPSFSDFDELHQLRAFISESSRWRPVSATGTPHKATSDITYEEYFIPAGTTLQGNHWAIHRDTAYYGEDVENFRPDRFLMKKGDDVKFNDELKTYDFGFGRRSCPGRHVAEASIFINTANILWAFSIKPMLDASGIEIPVDDLDFRNSNLTHPNPFAANIAPRIPNLRSIIQSDTFS